METLSVIVGLGGIILLLVGLVGGGFTFSGTVMPTVGRVVRIPCFLVGGVLLFFATALAVWQPEAIAPPDSSLTTSVNPTPGPNSPPAPPPASYGDDPNLDALWDTCAGGSLSACDSLYLDSAGGTEYERFGGDCGARANALNGSCADELPFPYTYGDDGTLDALSDNCAGGDVVACDQLYFNSPSGSDYESFGSTCGSLVDAQNGFCEEAAAQGLL